MEAQVQRNDRGLPYLDKTHTDGTLSEMKNLSQPCITD